MVCEKQTVEGTCSDPDHPAREVACGIMEYDWTDEELKYLTGLDREQWELARREMRVLLRVADLPPPPEAEEEAATKL